MSMPKAWALGSFNDSGADTNMVVKGAPWTRNSDGTYTYGATLTLLDFSSTALTNGTQSIGPAQDNDADNYDGVDCWISGTLGTGTAGVVSIFLVFADTSGNFPGDARNGENLHAFTPGATNPPPKLNFIA